jgi:hypothetical protein
MFGLSIIVLSIYGLITQDFMLMVNILALHVVLQAVYQAHRSYNTVTKEDKKET